ncbi:helix-turn-helix transcriptional regulator [Succinivibrio dextrinosolvens]|uniref:helix-turn-helix transcriptional regulator n=1 Tax=Succinivibrio dextrinosolvens TaxID=83771 RepID=UPI001920D2CF|nr:WYL domain-containing protein [Succinivibrio dextrinosolvens]
MSAAKKSLASPSEKLIALYSLLLFTRYPLSLTHISEHLQCSKQSVLRLVERIETSGYGRVIREKKGRETAYILSKPRNLPKISINAEGLHQLALCRNFLMHMLPQQMKLNIDAVIQETSAYLSDEPITEDFLSVGDVYTKGSVDHTPYQPILDTIIEAIRKHKVCKITYSPTANNVDKEYFLAPHRVTAFHDNLYVVGRLVTADGVAEPINDHNNTFLLHRFKNAEITYRNTDLAPLIAEQSEGAFGWFNSGEVFETRIRFKKEVAGYVTSRTWSNKQSVEYLDNGDFVLTMTVRSRNELISWILSFKDTATVLEPKDIRENVIAAARGIIDNYKD